jgi:hypothetical protein
MNAPLTPAELRALYLANPKAIKVAAPKGVATLTQTTVMPAPARGNWWHDPKARPPHHKCKNVRLTGKIGVCASSALNASNESVAAVSQPLAYVSPAEDCARRALDRILGRAAS